MWWLWLIISILVLLVLASLAAAYVLAHLMLEPRRHTQASCREREIERGVYVCDLDKLEHEDFKIKSWDGYELAGKYFPAQDGNREKFVIITHGHTYTMYGSSKYLSVFARLGYNAVIYDDRGHGANLRVPVTMGLKEVKDLNAVVEYVYSRFGKGVTIGLHGESMGSAISNMLLALRQDIDFVVSDCGYYDLYGYCRMLIRSRYHLPTYLVGIARVLIRLIYGFDINEVSPVRGLKDNLVPICFIHGKADDFIDPVNAKLMYDEDRGYKELHLFEGAKHAMSFQSDPDRYFEVVKNFLEKKDL